MEVVHGASGCHIKEPTLLFEPSLLDRLRIRGSPRRVAFGTSSTCRSIVNSSFLQKTRKSDSSNVNCLRAEGKV
jgi:hypothetical protein